MKTTDEIFCNNEKTCEWDNQKWYSEEELQALIIKMGNKGKSLLDLYDYLFKEK